MKFTLTYSRVRCNNHYVCIGCESRNEHNICRASCFHGTKHGGQFTVKTYINIYLNEFNCYEK